MFPSRTGRGTVDALLSYSKQGWKVSANASNIFNHHYWETAAISDGGTYPCQPAACTITVQRFFGGESSK